MTELCWNWFIYLWFNYLFIEILQIFIIIIIIIIIIITVINKRFPFNKNSALKFRKFYVFISRYIFRLHRRTFGYCSCKRDTKDTKERYWGQQFWQMERDISVRPTDRPTDRHDRTGQSEPFKAAPQYFAGTKPKWSVPFNVPTKIEWKAPNIIIIYYIEWRVLWELKHSRKRY